MTTNMFGVDTYAGRDGVKYPRPMWKALGFQVCPTLQTATGTERLYRVWTSASVDKVGRFFSFSAYRTRMEAEKHSNVMQYGNNINYQGLYSVEKGTPMWVGNADKGEFGGAFQRTAGSQIFIDHNFLEKQVRFVRNVALTDDMGGAIVHRRDDVGQLDS